MLQILIKAEKKSQREVGGKFRSGFIRICSGTPEAEERNVRKYKLT